MTVTDRGIIVHGLGERRLSPALRDRAPALAAEGEREGRCGWEPFFAALEARGEAIALEEGGARVVPRGAAGGPPAAAKSAVAEARAFLAALRGR